MSDTSDFLARWSRRKQEAKRVESDTPVESGSTEPLAEGEVAAADAPDAVLQISEEELAALPSIEDMTSETDLTQFLRAGIPAVLRKAALRRMWALDPAIRDYVGEALDYAYDWNTPGGVPGSGPMLATDDVQGMLRQIMGGTEAPVPEQDLAVRSEMPSQAETAQGAAGEGPDQTEDQPASDAPETSSPEIGGEPTESGAAASAATPALELQETHPANIALEPGGTPGEAESRMVTRRHGSAVPS